MKKLTRALLCAAVLALMLCTTAFAAENAVSIQLNGAPLTFTDAAPQIVEGRTYLPFRTVFTALGFEDENITYQAESKKVSAVRDGLSIVMVIGENQLTVTQDGKTTVVNTDAPAFIDPKVGRTYVPARFISEAAGCQVGWNGQTRTVFIDDLDALWAANTETYNILDQYLEYNAQLQKGSWQVDGSYTSDLGVMDETMNFTGDYKMVIQDGKAFDFDTAMKFAGEVEGESLAEALPDGLDMTMRGDLNTGDFYFKSNALLSLMDTNVQNMWFKFSLSQLMDAMASETGMTYAQMMELVNKQVEGMTGKDYMKQCFYTMAKLDAATSAASKLTMLNSMLGDKAFAKQGSTYVSNYTLQQDGADLAMTMRFTTTNNKVDGYTVSVAAKAQDSEMSMEMKLDREKKLDVSMKMATQFVSMEFTMDGKYTPTEKVPAGKPGEDAAVMDLMQQLLGAAAQIPSASISQ